MRSWFVLLAVGVGCGGTPSPAPIAAEPVEGMQVAVVDQNNDIAERRRVREQSIAAMNDGIMLFQSDRLDAAASQMAVAISFDSTNHMARYNLGQIRLFQKRWSEAAEQFLAARKLAPDDAMYAYRAGHALFKADDHAAAEPLLRSAIELEASLHRAHHLLGKVLEARSQDREAAIAYTRSCELSVKQSTRACRDLLWLYLRWDHNALATELITKVLARMPSSPDRGEVHYERGIVFERSSDCKSAVVEYTAALELMPTLAEARLQRGMCYATLGNKQAAKVDLEQYLSQGPSDAFKAQTAKQVLMRFDIKKAPRKRRGPKRPKR